MPVQVLFLLFRMGFIDHSEGRINEAPKELFL
jgi:hypothetical protein